MPFTLRREREAQARTQAMTIEVAACSCGWARSGDDVEVVQGAAIVHRLLHASQTRRAALRFAPQHPARRAA